MQEDAKECFERIYEETKKKVLAYIVSKCGNTDSINDIFQETYMELYKLILKRGSAYVTNAEGLVIRLANQKVYKHYRFIDRIKEFVSSFDSDNEEYIGDELFSENHDLDEKLADEEKLKAVKAFINTKPQIVQKIFIMYYAMDLSIPSIAEQLSISQSNVKHKLYRTLEEMRKKYKNW